MATTIRQPSATFGSRGAIRRPYKLPGVVYTPSSLATFLSDWAVGPQSQVLEPSAGDGQFLQAIAATGRARAVYAIEIDPDAAATASIRGGRGTSTFVGDFFTWYTRTRPDGQFDAVVGNPPFIRYQDFLENHRTVAFRLMRDEGLHPTRLTNAWMPFVVAATRALKKGGRLAMVLPAELLQVNYAQELREFLARKYARLHLITFRKLLFDGIEQEVVLLLGEREDSDGAAISLTEVEDVRSLGQRTLEASEAVHADIDHARDKWTQFFLTPKEFDFIRELRESVHSRLGDFAEVDVGIVTGRNEFFVLTRNAAIEWGLDQYCQPIVGKSAHVKGLLLRNDDWASLAAQGVPCMLMQLGPRDRVDLPLLGLRYVEWGESRGHHAGYKCRIRAPRWWNVPSVWVPDAFMTRQIHDGPRIVANHAGAVCTDTIHRLRTRPGVKAEQLAALSINSLTWAFSEINGRSYGGGVLELEPREAESLPIPTPSSAPELDLEELDAAARIGGASMVRDTVNRAVLHPAGMSKADIMLLTGIWERLSTRRLQRR